MADSPEDATSNLQYSCGDELDSGNLPQYWCAFKWSVEHQEWSLLGDSLPANYHCEPPNYDGSPGATIYNYPCANTPGDPTSDPDPDDPTSSKPLYWPSKTFKLPGLSERPASPPDENTSNG